MLKEYRFIEVLSKYLAYYYANKELSLKTKVNHQLYFNNIIEYLSKEGLTDMPAGEITANLIEDMRVHIIEKSSITYASRSIEMCKGAMDFAVTRGLVNKNPIYNLPTPRGKVKEKIVLNADEIKKLDRTKTRGSKKGKVSAKLLYLFQADTGLSFGDLKSYKIIKDDLGEWVHGTRCKTGNVYWVPLFKIAKEVLETCGGELPLMSNCKYNGELKTLSKDFGFNKNLTTHTARKTFATRRYEEGWSEESISDMMGITVDILRKHYIKKSRKRLENEFKTRMSNLKQIS